MTHHHIIPRKTRKLKIYYSERSWLVKLLTITEHAIKLQIKPTMTKLTLPNLHTVVVLRTSTSSRSEQLCSFSINSLVTRGCVCVCGGGGGGGKSVCVCVVWWWRRGKSVSLVCVFQREGEGGQIMHCKTQRFNTGFHKGKIHRCFTFI